MHRTILAAALLILSAVVGVGQQPRSPSNASRSCKGNPELVGQCFRIRGRAFGSNGTPDLRIWRVGSKRILGVTATATADDVEDPIAPENLLRALGPRLDHFVFGDFEVCPFTPERQGHMQMVCVERAENLVIESYGYGSKP